MPYFVLQHAGQVFKFVPWQRRSYLKAESRRAGNHSLKEDQGSVPALSTPHHHVKHGCMPSVLTLELGAGSVGGAAQLHEGLEC